MTAYESNRLIVVLPNLDYNKTILATPFTGLERISMKTFLLVPLCLLILSACSPASPQTQPAGGVTPLLTSLTPGDSSQTSQVSQPESASLSQPLAEVRDLAARRRIDLAKQDGWLHIQTRNVQAHPDPLSPFAPGLSQFIQDQWLALDGNGQIQRAVRKITDESGKTLQVSLLEHGIWYNLTLGAQSQSETSASFDPNFGFDELAARMVQQGYALNKSLLYRDCWYQGDKYTITDGHLTHEAVFNTVYREWRWIKTWLVTPKGDVSLVDSLEIMLEERVPQPSADVLAFLEQVSDLP